MALKRERWGWVYVPEDLKPQNLTQIGQLPVPVSVCKVYREGRGVFLLFFFSGFCFPEPCIDMPGVWAAPPVKPRPVPGVLAQKRRS